MLLRLAQVSVYIVQCVYWRVALYTAVHSIYCAIKLAECTSIPINVVL